MDTIKYERLCRRINYTFKDKSILQQALTHRSAGSENNERFEFLGDSVLSLVISNALFIQFPNRTEGELSRLRSYLVKGEMLAEVALEIDLGDHLFLGQGELKSGGFRRSSILADALEALFAAVFIDGGIEESKRVILHLFQSRLKDDNLNDNLKDPKTQLQEYLQSIKCPLPNYELTHVEGEEHSQVFHIQCKVDKLDMMTEGKGSNRRKAEQRAAQRMMKQIKTLKVK